MAHPPVNGIYNPRKKIHRIHTRLATAHGVEWELLQTCLGFAFTVQESQSSQPQERRSDFVAEGLHPALERIANGARNLTGATGAALALGNSDAMLCVARSGNSAPPIGAHFNATSGLSGESVRTGEPAICVNAAADPRVNYQACRALNIVSMLYFPLRSSQGKMIGMLGVFSSRPRHFSQRDFACLRFTEGLVQEAIGRSAGEPDPATLAVLLRQADFPAADIPSADIPSVDIPSVDISSVDISSVEILSIKEAAEVPLKPETPGAALTPAMPRLTSPAFRALPRPASAAPSDTSLPTSPRMPARAMEVAAPAKLTAAASEKPKAQFEVAPRPAPIFVGRVVDEAVQDSEPDMGFEQLTEELPRPSRIPIILALLVAVLVTVAALNYDRFFGRVPAEAKPLAPKAEIVVPSAVEPASQPAAEPEVAASGPERALTSSVRLRSAGANATVTILLPAAVAYEGYRLSNPDRVYFDLHDTRLTDTRGNIFRNDDGLISQVRLAANGPGTTRVVFDLRQPATFEARVTPNPQRLVIDLHRSSELPKDTEAVPSVPTRVTIVVDPGHGGRDLGTVSADGLREKDLTLDVALRLGALLRGRLGANVVFTRTGDEFVSLEDRVAIANQAHADFMISIHGNSSTVQSVRGVETYYFREAGSAESPGETHTAQAFAADVHRALISGLADTARPMRDRGVKQASFQVLREAQMPAALTEISFVSNRNDAPRLESEAYREQIARALYSGIANHLGHRSAHVAVSGNMAMRTSPVTP
jgi:N-acetylmuramoyl-L-alanine amidase